MYNWGMWVSRCLSHNKPTRTQPPLDLKLGNGRVNQIFVAASPCGSPQGANAHVKEQCVNLVPRILGIFVGHFWRLPADKRA